MGNVTVQSPGDLESVISTVAADLSRCRQVLDALPIAVYTTDAHGRLTYFNQATVELSGHVPQVGSDRWSVAWKLFHPDGTPMPPDQCPMAVALRERRPIRGVEVLAQRPDGTRFWFEPYPTPLFDAEGNLTGGINMLLDITQRKEAESDLQLDADALATLNELGSRLWQMPNMRAGIEEMLAATIQLLESDFGNVQLLEGDVLRIAAQRGFKEDFLEFFREVSTADDCACGRALRAGDRITIADVDADQDYAPYRDIARSAGYRAVLSVPLIGRDGKPRGMISTHWRNPHVPSERQLRYLDLYVRQATDFIERLEKEQAVRSSEERFRMIADNMGQLAWTCDQLGKATWYNKRWFDYTGLSFDQMKDWDWKQCHHPDHVERVIAGVMRCGATGETWEDTFPLRGADGTYRWFLSRAYPIRDERGKIVRWFGTNTDVTEQMAIEEDLRRARDEAEKANRAKDRFLAVLSHELRTPLSPVVMTVAAIQENPDLPFALREDIAMIRRNIELETRLIDDLLDLSRVISGKMRLQMQPTHVDEAIQHAVKNCESETLAKKLNVRLDLLAQDDLVKADPGRLQQVMWNLVRNAAKFTPAGGDIVIRTQNAGAKIVIDVRDNGVGIPAEYLPKIFDAFEQGDIKIARQFGGLGLAICKAVVEMHGGAIRAHSEGPGKGATFTVELATIGAAYAPSPDATIPSDGHRENGRLRVLIVEDHPDTREVLARLLRGSGYAVHTAGSVAATLQHTHAQHFDIVVSDLGLPDGTGYELMKEIRGKYGVKGIALSGYGMEEDQRRSREACFLDHIVKPVNVAQLEAVIKRVAASEVGG